MFVHANNIPKYVSAGVVVLLLLGILTPLPALATNGALHVILIGDTFSNIGEGIEYDLKNMTQLVREVAEYTGLDLQLHIYRDSDVTVEHVMGRLHGLQVGKNDVILFYNSTHGMNVFNNSGQGVGGHSVWPTLIFTRGQARSQWEYLAFNDVVQLLKSSGVRLVIGLADACNNYMDDVKESGVVTILEESYKKLFLYSQGYFFASSSLPGESSCISPFGSTFTNDFLTKLYDELSSPQPSWSNIRSYELSCPLTPSGKQHPQYENLVKKLQWFDDVEDGNKKIQPLNDVEDGSKRMCGIELTTIDFFTKQTENSFCIGDSIDVQLTNSCQEAVSVSIFNRDAAGNSWKMYSGPLYSGTAFLTSLMNTPHLTLSGPAGDESIWIEVNNRSDSDSQLIFEVQNCRN